MNVITFAALLCGWRRPWHVGVGCEPAAAPPGGWREHHAASPPVQCRSVADRFGATSAACCYLRLPPSSPGGAAGWRAPFAARHACKAPPAGRLESLRAGGSAERVRATRLAWSPGGASGQQGIISTRWDVLIDNKHDGYLVFNIQS